MIAFSIKVASITFLILTITVNGKLFMGKIRVQNRNVVGDSVRKLAYDIPERNFSTFLPRDAMHPRY